MQWFKVKVDLSELAKKRWIEGHKIEKLMAMTNLAKSTIEQHLRKVRGMENLDSLHLTDSEKRLIGLAIERGN